MGYELISFKLFKLKSLKFFFLANVYKYCIFKKKLKKKNIYNKKKKMKKKKRLKKKALFPKIVIRKKNGRLKKTSGKKAYILKIARTLIEDYFDLVLKNPIKLKLRSVFNFKKSEVLKISKHMHRMVLNN
jgi:hypothetical protein